MRIAQVAPLYESVPPRCYGGTERVVSYLTEELVKLDDIEFIEAIPRNPSGKILRRVLKQQERQRMGLS